MSTSSNPVLRQVARTPLVQASAVLWLVGASQLIARLPDGLLQRAWPAGVALAAVTAALLLGYHRLLWLAAVPVLLGLFATLALTLQLGAESTTGFGTAACAYALMSWHAAGSLLALPWSAPAARLLGIAGGHGSRGGRALVEAAAHWCGLGVCLLVVLGLVPVAFLLGSPTWPMLAVGGTFFALAGWRYHRRLHSYALLASLLLGVWIACATTNAPGTNIEDFLSSPTLGLWTVAFSIALGAAALLLERHQGDGGLGLARTLYLEPLRMVALLLALLVIAHQAVVMELAALFGREPPSTVIALLAGGALLFADHARARPAWSFLGALVVWLALYPMALGLLLPGWHSVTAEVAAEHALVLAALALVVAGTGRLAHRRAARYAGPLHVNAGIAFAAAALVAAAALTGPGGPVLTIAMALLVAAAIPVLAPCTPAPHWRGLAVPVLLTGFVASLLAVPEMGLAGIGQVSLAWGFVLWLLGSFAVARWNVRFVSWSMSEAGWPWFGLAFVLAGCAWLATTSPWLALAGGSAYFYLLIRNNTWVGFPWLATAALTAAGLALCGWWTLPFAGIRWQPVTAGSLFASIVWLNAVLAAVPVWRRRGPALAASLGWRRADLDQPMLACSAITLLATLAGLVVLVGTWATGVTPPFDTRGAAIVAATGLALAASFLNANRVEPRPVFAHALLLALLAVLSTVTIMLAGADSLALSIALGGVALLAAWRRRARIERPGTFAAPIDAALSVWVRALPVAAAALALLVPPASTAGQLVVLAVVLANAAGIGWWQNQRGWLAGAVALALVLEHVVWLLWLPLAGLDRALPWFALAGAANTFIALWLIPRLDQARSAGSTRAGALRAVLAWALPVVVLITVAELVTHLVWVAGAIAANVEGRWLSDLDVFAALASWLVLAALSVRTAHRRLQGRWIYAAALLGGGAAAYLRVVTIGLAPPGTLDTVVIIGAAYALFAVQRLTLSTPTMHVCLVLPLLALLTLPAQTGSVHAGAALMAIAVLYLLIRARTLNPIPLYLGVLALNASVYLWIPLWADRFGMFQLYVMPAAVSVLALVHLHRRELRPSVLNGARLAALATLYCGAALDVFAHPSLAMFALALGLSLASVVIGIAFRIRAFLYAGIAFLVLNVGYQLVQLYPEQRLGRAILLIALGVAITGGMIGFNIKREAIMARIRIMRADLDAWE